MPHPFPTVGEVGERQIIAAITDAAPSAVNGDDAAVLHAARPNSRTVVTTDMLVEGQHFRREWSTPQEIGRKAIVANYADLQAMGARPVGALLALCIPEELPVDFVRSLAAGVSAQVEEFGTELVGGDVTAGSLLVVSVTGVGSLGGALPELTLAAARPGQKLIASGAIGESAAGLALLRRFGRAVPDEFVPLRDAHTRPRLVPGRGMIARATGATAATDNSDGLVRDVGVIARRSQVSIDLDSRAIAPSPLMCAAGELLGIDPWQWVLSGGEDHTILATTTAEATSGFTVIGRVGRGNGVTVDSHPPAYDAGWLTF